MSLNVLNKKFLSLLRNLDIDIDVFPNKSFDGLFENKQNDLNYFLEWFVGNISSENALTEAEVDVYQYLQACNMCISDEELNDALVKCTPSYEDLSILDESYINSLSRELEELNAEYQKLMNISYDLETKYNEIKKKPNHLKEECNRMRKKIDNVKEELQMINSTYIAVDEDINNLKINDSIISMCLEPFKEAVKKEEQLVQEFRMHNFRNSETPPLYGESAELSKLVLDLGTSQYLSVVSESLLEGTKFKISKAEEFLGKLKDESDSHFTFDEILSLWHDLDELSSYDNLKEEVYNAQLKDISVKIDKECELICHNFLSQFFHSKSCKNEVKISRYSEFISHIKSDIVNNLFLQQFINLSLESQKECKDMIERLCCSLNESKSRVKNAVDSLRWKNKRSQDYIQNMNDKHALLLSCKKLNVDDVEEKILFNRSYDIVKLLLDNPGFYPDEIFGNLECKIASAISNVLSGPTDQIQMVPFDVQWEFNKCEKLIMEHSHSIQRLLTDYVNTKESVSSSNRKQTLLWMDFLMKPEHLVSGLEELQEESVKYASKLSGANKT